MVKNTDRVRYHRMLLNIMTLFLTTVLNTSLVSITILNQLLGPVGMPYRVDSDMFTGMCMWSLSSLLLVRHVTGSFKQELIARLQVVV